MLRSKKDVDRHVRDLLSKVRSEEERKLRGYNIARLYFNISECESARRYLSEFLSVRPKAVDAHRLLGQIYEGLGNKEKAVQAFKNAYELGEGQKDLILKICELYTEVQADSGVRLYWAEEGQRVYPHHNSVVKLREALLTASPTHSKHDLEKLYIDEIKANPTVVRLQTNLLKLYKDWGAEDTCKIKEAYNYGCQVEARKAFSDSLEWYQTLMEVIQTYQTTADVKTDVEFHINYLSSLERLVYLTLSACSGTALVSQCTVSDAAALLHKFDQDLKGSISVVGTESQFGQLMIGQLYFHMAVFLMHSAKKDGLTHGTTSAGSLLFHACRFRGRGSGREGRSWTPRDQVWQKLSCHRLSQAAHVLTHMAKTDGEKLQFLNNAIQQCCNKEAQLNMYQTLYGASLANKKEKSYFLNDESFITASLTYPDADQVKEWDNVVGSMYCGSLIDMVWLCLQQVSTNLREPQPYYPYTLFEGLQFSTSNVNTGAPETLCHLDLLAFLAATVYCQVAAAKESHGPAPASLPTVLVSGLSTNEQTEWWSAAYTLFTNRAHQRLSKLRMVLQRGLEVIRAHGNHGVELPLMAHLAKCFTKWATEAENDGSTSSEVEALRERSEHYWQRVLTLSQRAARNVATITPRNPLFMAYNDSLTIEEREKIEEEGKFFLAMRMVQSGRQQEAIQALAELKSPEASFQRAMLYKEQAQNLVNGSSSEVVSVELRLQQTTLLTQARDTLYLTLDRLRMPGVDRFHPLNTKLSQQLEDVERRLSHLNLEQSAQGHREEDSGSLSDASQSPNVDITNGDVGVGSQSLHLFSTPHRDKTSSRIARQEARPSPERLDAQLRALSEVQENTLRNMEEQNSALKVQNEALRNFCTTMADEVKENSSLYRSMLEQNKTLSQEAYASVLGELKLVHAAIKDIQTQIQIMAADISELKEMKSDAVKLPEVAEVKTSEEQVPVEMPAPATAVAPGLYGSYMGYYGQQPVPSPLMPAPGLFGNPPFFPPSTLPEQSYSLANSVSQVGPVSSLSQVTSSLVTPTPRASSKDHTASHTTFAHQGGDGSPGAGLNVSWSVAPAPGTPAVSVVPRSQASDAVTPPHAFQITMPPSSATITPPSHSASAFLGPSKSPGVSGMVDAKVSPVKSGSEDDDRYQDDDHDPCPDFKPVVPLPEKVEVRTGEEDEEVLFEERAKLFRFVEKEWRERGTGVMKLLHNIAQGCARVLMRRDQTHKICANHLVTANTELQPMKNNDKVWIWAAQDFADEELRMEKFCCRFKTVEIASNFKEAFLKSKAIAKEKEEKDKSASAAQQDDTSDKATVGPTTKPSLAEMFRPPAGSWNCEMCLVSNRAESTKCVACDTPNPNAPQPPTTSAAQTTFASFKFSPTSSTSDSVVSAGGFKFISPSVTITKAPQPPASSPFSFKFGLSERAEEGSDGSGATVVSAPTTSPNPEANKDTGKFSLSGFTFTTTPTLKPEKPEESVQKPQEDKKKESVFKGFSFGSSSTSGQAGGFSFGTPTLGESKAGEDSGTSSGSLFGNKDTSGSTLTFGSLIPSSSPGNIFTTKNTKAFEPKTVFGGSSSPSKSPGKSDGDDHVEEYEPQVDFQPVVPMPDLVEVKTGEEEEEVLFCERSKLFRYDKDSKEWKERGIGDLKILKNNASGKVRVLMRREQVLKVCANHFLSPLMKLTPLASSDKAWTWAARDFADEEMKEEQFAARFKTQELAQAFKAAFDKAQASLESEPKAETTTSSAASTSVSSTITTTTSTAPSLAAMFKPAAGSWECESCLVRNSADKNTCAACSANKPGYEPPKGETSDAAKPSITFGIKQGENVSSLSDGFVFGTSGNNPTFTFGVQPATQPAVSASTGMPAFSFGFKVSDSEVSSSTKPAFPFGLPGTQASSSSQESTTTTTTSDTKPAFSFGVPTTQPSSSQESTTTASETRATFSFGLPTTQPSSSSQESTTTTISDTKTTFSFGLPSTQPSSSSSSQESTTTTSDTQPTFSFGTATTQSNKPFTFTWQPVSTATGSVAETSNATKTSTTAAPTTTTPVPIPSATKEPSTPSKSGKTEFMFGSPGKYEFSFTGVKAKSPRSRDISLCESEDGLVEEDDGDHLYFEPVIPLPDKVDVVTGEEDEKVLYSHRAKLFRLVGGEWKERGLGDVKLLSHNQTKKIRIIMRREQVHKICLNHYLTKDIEFRKKDEKTFFWAAVDYSENTALNETLAIRFKTSDIAQEFFKAVNDVKVSLGGTSVKLEPPSAQSSPAPGVQEPREASPAPPMSAAPSPITAITSTTTTIFTMQSSSPSIFGAATGKSIFGGSPSTGTSSPSIFGGNAAGSPLFGNTPKSSASIFGGSAASPSIFTQGATSSPSIFGGTPTSTKSVFGGAKTTTSSIFGGPVAFGFGNKSIFGGGTTTSTMPRSTFSFGDKTSSEPESTDDVEIVFEKKATADQVEQARKLQLPDNFFLYEDASPCPGCRGCKDEDEESISGTVVTSSGSTSFKSGPQFGILSSGSPSLFGSSPINSPNIFEKTSAFNATSIFSATTTSSTGSIFGSAGNKAGGRTGNLFGVKPGGTSLFGSASVTTTGSATTTATTSTSSAGGLFSATITTTTTSTASPGGLFSNTSASVMSFGDVAAHSPNTGFGQKSAAADAVWAARGQPIFKTTPKKGGGEGDEDDDDDADAHDPHFEPVVPLPDLVEVKTGEEDMTVIFSHRAKLYRYDAPTKQWKERGVGDFKILHDSEKNKYRLLQRREQVHKLCCNHYLTPQLELRAMQTSETAWCWYAVDFSDNMKGTNEQLAVKFKTKELAAEFKARFEECQEKLRNIQASNSATVDTSAVVVVPQIKPRQVSCSEEVDDDDDDDEEEEEDDDEDEDEDSEEEDEDDDDDDDDDEDGDDAPVIFCDRSTLSKKEGDSWKVLGSGELRIRYDDGVYGARVVMTSDDGQTLAEHIIAIQTIMHREGNAATWTVLNLKPEPATTTTFKAHFPTDVVLESFCMAFTEGKDYADKAGIFEKPSAGGREVAPGELYYGQGADQQGVGAEHLLLDKNSGSSEKKGFPFNLNEMKTCDPALTRELASALQEYSPSLDSESVED